jgi:hypothetical protein
VEIGRLHVVEKRQVLLHGNGAGALDNGEVAQQGADGLDRQIDDAWGGQSFVGVKDVFDW